MKRPTARGRCGINKGRNCYAREGLDGKVKSVRVAPRAKQEPGRAVEDVIGRRNVEEKERLSAPGIREVDN